MHKTIKRRYAMLHSVRKLGEENQAILTAPINSLVEAVSNVITQLDTLGGAQVFGRGSFQAGAEDRTLISAELEQTLREIAQLVGFLDPGQYPGVADQFQMPELRNYNALLSTAHAFVEALPPFEAEIIAQGYPANFLAELKALIASFDTATQRKHGGLQDQVSGTLGLEAVSRQGVALVRQMNALMSRHLRKTNPTLLQLWKRASRMERAPQRKKEEAPAAAPAPASSPLPQA